MEKSWKWNAKKRLVKTSQINKINKCKAHKIHTIKTLQCTKTLKKAENYIVNLIVIMLSYDKKMITRCN